MLLGSNVAHTLLLLVALALLVNGKLELTHLYILSGCFGLLSAFFMPASLSIVPQLVPREVLPRANALRALAAEFTGIVGPTLGGVLITAGGLSLALAFDTLTFGLGALCLLAVRPQSVRRERLAAQPVSYLQDLKGGLAYVASSSWLWVTIVLFSFGNVFAGGAAAVLLPLFSETRFAGASALGWLLSSMAGGALLAALVLNRVRLRRRGWTAYLAVAMAGMSLMALSLSPNLLVALVMMTAFGASLAVFGVVWETTMQSLVPQDVLGRVVSLDMLGSFALLPLGHLLTGTLAETYGAAAILLVYGGATLALALIGLWVPAVRQLD